MRANGWDTGCCVYDQEAVEHTQLFFSHQFKTGDPYAFAHNLGTEGITNLVRW